MNVKIMLVILLFVLFMPVYKTIFGLRCSKYEYNQKRNKHGKK